MDEYNSGSGDSLETGSEFENGLGGDSEISDSLEGGSDVGESLDDIDDGLDDAGDGLTDIAGSSGETEEILDDGLEDGLITGFGFDDPSDVDDLFDYSDGPFAALNREVAYYDDSLEVEEYPTLPGSSVLDSQSGSPRWSVSESSTSDSRTPSDSLPTDRDGAASPISTSSLTPPSDHSSRSDGPGLSWLEAEVTRRLQELRNEAEGFRQLGEERFMRMRERRGQMEHGLRQSRRLGPQPDGRRADRLEEEDRLQDVLVEMEVERIRESRRQAAPAAAPREQGHVPVIDLTEEPDSPEQPILALPDQPRFARVVAPDRLRPQQHATSRPTQVQSHGRRNNQHSQNSRRQMSRIRRTPSLARSDGSLLGGPGNNAPDRRDVIDLTADSPPRPEPPQTARDRPQNGGRLPAGGANALPELAYLGFIRRQDLFTAPLGLFHRLGFGRQPDVEVEVIGQNQIPDFVPNMENPLANNPVNFNYQAGGLNRAPSPKPAHEPPPAARSGFTRNTGEDLAIICPSCEQELKYDPGGDDVSGPPAKRPRTKKDREEHHFWAVKACGHVYCRNCFENRKPTVKNLSRTGFRSDQSKRVFCAVEDCDSDVANKTAWVGIFL